MRLNSCRPPSRCRGTSCGAWGQGTSTDKAGLASLGKSPALGILWDEPKSPLASPSRGRSVLREMWGRDLFSSPAWAAGFATLLLMG